MTKSKVISGPYSCGGGLPLAIQLRMMKKALVLLLMFVTSPQSSVAEDSASLHHAGYLSDVDSERSVVYQKLKVVAKPKQNTGPELSERIFNARLKREFREKYREKFGRTSTENLINTPTPFTVYSGLAEADSEAANTATFRGNHLDLYKENQRFGSYMFRRLTEYHVDQYMRNRPVVQKVYQLKEKYSRVNLQFSKKVRLKVRYQIAENSLRMQLENPWLKNQLVIEMDSAALGPSQIIESTLSLFFPRVLGVDVQGHFKAYDQSYLLVGSRRLTASLTANLTGHWNRSLLIGPLETDIVREDLILGGLNWRY